MIVPEKFNEIKPWGPEELPEVYDRLLQNEQFKKVLAFLFPGVPLEAIAGKLKTCKTNLEFQKAFVYDFIKKLMLKASTGFELQDEELDRQGCYTFISNHRDIVFTLGEGSCTCEQGIYSAAWLTNASDAGSLKTSF